MQDKARLFAYSTWVIMISLAIMIFSDQFLHLISEPGWRGLIILFCFGLIYMNLTYNAVKRYIRKVPAPTQAHFVLGALIFFPPVVWMLFIRETISSSELLLIGVLALSCGLGVFFGNRSGIRARYEYVQKVKEYQKKQKEKSS